MSKKFEDLAIGIPKETMAGERRVAGTPKIVEKLVQKGASVLVESGAGERAFFSDKAYKDVGATIVEDVSGVFSRADIIIKVKEPLYNKEKGLHEVDMMKKDQVLVAFLHPAAPAIVVEDMVKSMKPGSVIVDISIDQGGNCNLTEGGKVIEKYGVIIDGTKNIPGTLPTSSTWMLAENIYNFLAYLVDGGRVNLDVNDEIIRKTLVTNNGEIVYEGVKKI